MQISCLKSPFVTEKGSVRGRSHHMKPRTKQSVKSLLMSDHEIRDLSNQSFRFNDLYHEAVLCVAFSSNGEEVIAGGHSGNVKVFNLKVSLEGNEYQKNLAAHDFFRSLKIAPFSLLLHSCGEKSGIFKLRKKSCTARLF